MVEKPPAVYGPDLRWAPLSERWALKKAGHECVDCIRPLYRNGRCEWHYYRLVTQMNAAQRRRRAAAKVNGICTNCLQRLIASDSQYCEICGPKVAALNARWNHSSRGRQIKRASAREFRRKRREDGLCTLCDEPTVTELFCDAHARAKRAYTNSKRPPAKRITRCKLCRKPGHYAPGCTEKFRERLNLEEYATARTYVPIDP